MFRFENPLILYLLLLIPIFTLGFVGILYLKKKQLAKFGNIRLLQQLMPRFSQTKQNWKFALLLSVLLFLFLAWANPQFGTKTIKVKAQSSDIFIALDISDSMLSDDIRPNRIERAKQFSLQLLEKLKGNRVGIIIFAGNAFLQMPLTNDYSAAAMFLKSASTDMASSQGTAIGEAIEVAEKSFSKDNKNNKALVVITDGETHDNDALATAKSAYKDGLLILTIGVGSKDGGKIPIFYGGQYDYKRDETGKPIVTKLNEDMLKDLANAGNGIYLNLNGDDANIATTMQNALAKLEKREMEQRSFSEYESYFQYFIFFALIILGIEVCLSETLKHKLQ